METPRAATARKDVALLPPVRYVMCPMDETIERGASPGIGRSTGTEPGRITRWGTPDRGRLAARSGSE